MWSATQMTLEVANVWKICHRFGHAFITVINPYCWETQWEGEVEKLRLHIWHMRFNFRTQVIIQIVLATSKMSYSFQMRLFVVKFGHIPINIFWKYGRSSWRSTARSNNSILFGTLIVITLFKNFECCDC